MEWIKAENKPKIMTCALVINTNGWMLSPTKLAFYHPDVDEWVIYSPDGRESYTLKITHYFPIPEAPKE